MQAALAVRGIQRDEAGRGLTILGSPGGESEQDTRVERPGRWNRQRSSLETPRQYVVARRGVTSHRCPRFGSRHGLWDRNLRPKRDARAWRSGCSK